jgi:hypothetical protein
MYRQLCHKLHDPPPHRPQLLQLHRAQTPQLITIDQLLPTPSINRLAGDLQQPGDLGNRLTRRDQIRALAGGTTPDTPSVP